MFELNKSQIDLVNGPRGKQCFDEITSGTFSVILISFTSFMFIVKTLI